MSHFPAFDLYGTLHLPKNASAEDVRTHYVRIIRRNHIDNPEFLGRIRSQFPVQPGEAEARYRERIAEIAKRSVQRFNVAYEILSNPIERRAYDRHIEVSASRQEAPKQDDPVVKRSDMASHEVRTPKPDDRQFFNRGSNSAQGSRRLRTKSDPSGDKYCFWKR